MRMRPRPLMLGEMHRLRNGAPHSRAECLTTLPKEATHTSPQARGPAKVHGPMAVENTRVHGFAMMGVARPRR